MSKHLISLMAAGLLVVSGGSLARADGVETVLLGHVGWEAFTGTAPAGSLAWAGEDEGFATSPTLPSASQQFVAFDDQAIDIELLTALAAPEPPALVLAGMAFGGVLCGRTLLMRRRAKVDSDVGAEESRG